MCGAEEVVAAFVSLLPKARNRGGGVRTGIPEDGRPEMDDERPEQTADEDDSPEHRECGFRQDGTHPSRNAARVLQAGPERRHARPDEDLVRSDQRAADGDVRPHDAVEGGRKGCECDDLRNDAGADDPRIARLAAREVVTNEYVRQRKQADRERKRSEYLAAF